MQQGYDRKAAGGPGPNPRTGPRGTVTGGMGGGDKPRKREPEPPPPQVYKNYDDLVPPLPIALTHCGRYHGYNPWREEAGLPRVTSWGRKPRNGWLRSSKY